MTGTCDATTADGVWLPAVGAGRRIRALAAAGWSLYEQARRVGLSTTAVSDLAWDRREWITRTVSDAVAELYAELEHLPGGSSRARNLARREGWPPPAAWNPDEIDKPAALAGDSSNRRCPYCGAQFRPNPDPS